VKSRAATVGVGRTSNTRLDGYLNPRLSERGSRHTPHEMTDAGGQPSIGSFSQSGSPE
jgi:hypothetical protein